MRNTLTVALSAIVIALTACDSASSDDASTSEDASELRRRFLSTGVTSLDRATVAPGESIVLSTTYKVLRAPNDALSISHALVDPSGAVVARVVDAPASPLVVGQPFTISTKLTVPAGTVPGALTVATRATDSSGAIVYQSSPSAASVTVTAAPADASASAAPVVVAPAVVAPGGAIIVKAAVVSPRTVDGAAVLIQVVDESYAVVDRYVVDGQHLDAGKTAAYEHAFTLPATLVAGHYYVSAGVFSADWSETLVYYDRGAAFDVGVGTATPAPGAPAPTYPPASMPLTLAFREEFDADLYTQWVDHEPYWGPPGTAAYGNGSWFQAPAGSLAEVAGGVATLRNRACQNPGGFAMCGADLSTRGKFDTFVHGHVEARAKIPGNAGGFPAFWLMGNGLGDQAWPKTGEIDIFEFVNNGRDNGVSFFTVHWSCPQDQWGHCSKTYETPPRLSDYTADYHVWSFTRTHDVLESRIDGFLAAKITRAELATIGGDYGVLFDGPMHVRLDLANGGEWAADPSRPAGEGDFLVDYVRVWNAP